MSNLKSIFVISIALLAWFAVVTQFFLMMDNRVTSIIESVIRFFSFFTILTNSLVAIYYSKIAVNRSETGTSLIPGWPTALTIYIFVVGLVYQLVLRQIWEPTGLQMIVDELLHSVIPTMVLIYWIWFVKKNHIAWNMIPYWLIYPMIYLIYVLIRGQFSGFYPYPFLNLNEISSGQLAINVVVLILTFIFLSVLFVFLARQTIKRKELNKRS